MKGRLRPVEYLAWAQTVPSGARWDLTASGVPDSCGSGPLAMRAVAPAGEEADAGPEAHPQVGAFTLDALGLELADLCRRDRRAEIVADFCGIIGARYGLDPECVVPTLGASGAITQVLLGLARPGDHVIVERPTYEPLHRIPEMLGLSVSRLERRFEEGWEPLPDRLARLLTPKTRAVILSSLHNPSGVAMRRETLEAVGEMAARVGAMILVDEVYLDFDFGRHGEGEGEGEDATSGPEPRPWLPAALAIDNGLSWSSTTKCFGFAALRAGWAVTRDRDAAQALRLASHYLHVDPPLPALAMAAVVMRRAEALEAQAAAVIARSRAQIDAWIASEPRVGWVPPSAGQTGLIRLPDLMQDQVFADHLRQGYDTQVVPGTLFEAPGMVRVSFNLPTEALAEALANFSATLDDLTGR